MKRKNYRETNFFGDYQLIWTESKEEGLELYENIISESISMYLNVPHLPNIEEEIHTFFTVVNTFITVVNTEYKDLEISQVIEGNRFFLTLENVQYLYEASLEDNKMSYSLIEVVANKGNKGLLCKLDWFPDNIREFSIECNLESENIEFMLTDENTIEIPIWNRNSNSRIHVPDNHLITQVIIRDCRLIDYLPINRIHDILPNVKVVQILKAPNLRILNLDNINIDAFPLTLFIKDSMISEIICKRTELDQEVVALTSTMLDDDLLQSLYKDKKIIVTRGMEEWVSEVIKSLKDNTVEVEMNSSNSIPKLLRIKLFGSDRAPVLIRRVKGDEGTVDGIKRYTVKTRKYTYTVNVRVSEHKELTEKEKELIKLLKSKIGQKVLIKDKLLNRFRGILSNVDELNIIVQGKDNMSNVIPLDNVESVD